MVAALLALMGGLQIASMREESQTYDEGLHLAAGVSYWKTGDFRANPEHPPLGKLLAAVPLLLAGVEWNIGQKQWHEQDQFTLAGPFVYRNKIDADLLLFLGRLPTVLVSLGLGLGIALTGKRLFGPLAGIVALALYATDPNFIAHGHYITNDVLAAAAVFGSAITWLRAVETDRRRDWAIAAAMLGLALTVKFSTLFLIPVHAAIAWWNGRLRLRWLAAAFAVVGAMYGPETLRLNTLPPLADRIPTRTKMGEAVHAAALDFRVPGHHYLDGVWQLISHQETGHRTYLLGEVKETGTWKYFFVAFAVKTPTAVLLLLALTAWRVRPALWMNYPAVYFMMSLGSSLNLGLRHLLPVYPFLFLWIGAGLAWRWWPVLLVALGLQVYEVGRTAPYYTAFFNRPSGGAENGHKILLDSNLDWGQDAKRLGRWVRERQLEKICVSYFGTASLDYYGIAQIPIAHARQGEGLDCWAAVCANDLYDLYLPAGTHAWTRKLTPAGTIGHSIFLYDLRRGIPR